MPRVTANDLTTDVPSGTRLVLAVMEAGVAIGHRCGGKARCTTCRVEVHEGGDPRMTRAEFVRLRDAGLLGEVRLACQIVVEDDMTVTALKTLESEGWTDTGPQPAPEVLPEAAWFELEELERDTPAT
jgi:ferredoxin